jgi:hypothetical protein
MDDALINVIRWKQYFNIDMINSDDTELSMVNVPINNCFIRITSWRRHINPPIRVQIRYSVIEANTFSRNYTFIMNEEEFLRRIDITGI